MGVAASLRPIQPSFPPNIDARMPVVAVQTAEPQGPTASDNREHELIARAADGDDGAARTLYDLHVQRVFGLTYRLTGDRQLAAELTQDTFVSAFRKLSSFRSQSAFGTWLHRIAVRTTLNGLRARRRHSMRETDLEQASVIEARQHDADPVLRARLHAAIDQLSEALRTNLILHAVEGMTHVQIAEALGIPVGTSKARVSQARTILRAALADLSPLAS